VTPSQQVETTLFRALTVLRAVVTVHMVVLNLVRWDEFARPGLAAATVAFMVAWSVFVSWAYDSPSRRTLGLYVADLAVALAMMLSTPLVQSQEMLDRHASTMPSFWVVAPVLAWAAGRHWSQAVGAAVLVSVTDLSVRTDLGGNTWGNLFLLVLAAGMVGWTAQVLRDAVEMRAAAERAAAVQEERTRLARAVHDGVLQVLTMVQRRGAEAGGELAELGRVAGEQEAALRALVQYDARARAPETNPSGGGTDLMVALERLHCGRVTVAGPGAPVPLPHHDAEELGAVVSACLDNVRAHVGADAAAWVFVEDLGDAVVVSVRDEGAGIPAGRVEEAAREGRMGIRDSVCGRISDLGGRAELTTGPGQGTEWELTLPRRKGAR
jgi:signal transduction histidine kinase